MIRLFDEQVTAINKLKNGNILIGGVGTGKSLTSLGYYHKCTGGDIRNNYLIETTYDIPLYIITTAKKRNDKEWEDEIKNFPNMSATIDSWQNICKYDTVKSAFFIFDEQKAIGRGKWAKAFQKIGKNNNFIMLSATPADVWNDYIPIFLANKFYKNRTEFNEQHVVFCPYAKFPKILYYKNQVRLINHRSSILVDIPIIKHTMRIITDLKCGYNLNNYNKVLNDRWNIYEDMPIEQISELYYTLRRVVNSDETRIHRLKVLLTTHSKIILFYSFNYELDIIKQVLEDQEITYSEYNGHKHQRIPSTPRWVYVVQYTAGAEGWNCIQTNVIVYWSLTYSWKQFEQSMGRIDRLNTTFTELRYFKLTSESSIDKAIQKSLDAKQKFNEEATLALL